MGEVRFVQFSDLMGEHFKYSKLDWLLSKILQESVPQAHKPDEVLQQ